MKYVPGGTIKGRMIIIGAKFLCHVSPVFYTLLENIPKSLRKMKTTKLSLTI